MIFGLQLLIAHLLGDFVFQSDKWVKNKEERKIKSKYLYYHILIHFVLMIVLTGFEKKYFGEIAFISISHYIIDVAKLYIQKNKTKKALFFVDQILHLAVLALVWYIFEPFKIDLTIIQQPKVLLTLVFLLFNTYVAAIVLKVVLQKWNPITNYPNGTNNAGQIIGILERLFIFLFVTMNFWEGVGFLLAAKSIFRFGDLKEKQEVRLTEYILIGTLLSFGIGIGCGLAYKYLLSHI